MKSTSLVFVALLSFALLQSAVVHSQVSGCKDPAATNYNPSATVNDGSCAYPATSYTPPVKVDPLNIVLNENSGLQWAGGSLWTFNDEGGAALYRIDTASNAILQTVNLSGATNADWEDIAFDGTYLYIGDFGNNGTGRRTDLRIYKFPLSAIPSDYANNPTVTVTSIEVINFSYGNQTDFSKDTLNYTRFDCEAMIADGGKLHLFSKNWIDVNTTHYVINGTAAGTYTADSLETLATGYLVTAADKAPGLNTAILLGYQNGLPYNHYLHLLSDFGGGRYFNGNKRRIDLPNAAEMGQAEGIAFRTATYGFLGNERITYGPFTITQKLRSFNTAGFVPVYVLPLTLLKFTVGRQAEKHVINWKFASLVMALQILHSSDGVNFRAVKTEAASSEGALVYEPSSPTNCYRLQWQQTDGRQVYSNVVCAENKMKTGFTNLFLRKSGELSFVWSGAEADDYTIKLLSTDGKLLAQTTQRINTAGYHTVRFASGVERNVLVLVQVTGRKTQYATVVKVQE